MCYSALVKRDLDDLHRRYGAIVIREQVEDYLQASAAAPKLYPPLADRIYPGHYAPVICPRAGERVIGIQRYGAYPPLHIANPSRYTTFNARLENLSSPFWSQAFGHHHGMVVFRAFYEWVEVKTLLQAGVVSIDQVRATFTQQMDGRRKHVEAAGKVWKPTPTEVKDPRLRKIIIEFRPLDGADLMIPVIFSLRQLEGCRVDAGFAVVTYEPPPEISEAGHDRCPVVLDTADMDAWMNPQGKTAAAMAQLLKSHRRVVFRHALPKAA